MGGISRVEMYHQRAVVKMRHLYERRKSSAPTAKGASDANKQMQNHFFCNTVPVIETETQNAVFNLDLALALAHTHAHAMVRMATYRRCMPLIRYLTSPLLFITKISDRTR